MQKTGDRGSGIEKTLAGLLVCLFGLSIPPFLRSSTLQCADGTPMPCRTAAATARRDPPLDSRTWIVLPFTNVARASDLDWLSDASVSLLYTNMSRWTDLRVVDDERVTDLLRDTPEAARTRLGLQAGLALARRAGAGTLVMGELLTEGQRTAVTAKVFDTRTGNRLRTVTVRIVGTDSLSSAYGRLAEQALAVPPPSGTTLSGLGTTSMEAVRAYAAGMQAYNRWRLDSALAHFRRAVTFDSTFALGHLKVAQALYAATGSTSIIAPSLAAAQRFSDGLPQRERLVIAAFIANSASVCDIASQLLRLDSLDVEGWLATGECRPPSSGRVIVDSTGQAQFVMSANPALRAYRRALELQPGNIQAFSAIMTAFLATGGQVRLGCAVAGACPFASSYSAAIGIVGDTIHTAPEPYSRIVFRPPITRSASYGPRRAALMQARAIAAAYTAANPRQWRARALYGYILLGLGDLSGADRELRAAEEAATIRGDRRTYYRDRIELELRRERPRAAAALLDSMFLDGPASAQPQFFTALGRFSRDVGAGDTGRVRALRTDFMTPYSGVVPADFDRTLVEYAAIANRQSEPTLREAGRMIYVVPGTILAFHARRTRDAADTASSHPLVRYQAWFARGDTARARRALAEYDTWLDDAADDVFTGWLLFSAESHLELGDSSVALARMQRFGREWAGYWLNISSMHLQFAGPSAASRLIGRAWLLYADLAIANGHRDDARRGYRMVEGLWEGGEAPVQPAVARARAALASLGN